jgi:leader peptidase (prepilin peptidase)/N-methyltransferase
VLTISLSILGLTAAFFEWTSTTIESSLLGLAIGYGLPWIVNKIYYAWRKQDGFGAGDFKLLAALGIWLGWKYVIPILFASAVLAIIYALFLNLIGQKINLKTQLPYGPFLITVSVLLFFSNFFY